MISDSSNYNLQKLSLDDVVRAAREGDKLCTTVLGEATEYLSIGVVNVVNLFNPDIVIFGGTLAKSHDLVIDSIKRSIKARCLPNSVRELKMEISAFGEDGPALGAATLAIRDYLSKMVL
jgi:glucokinase